LAGFALGIIVLAVCLHFFPPILCAILIAAYGLITQGYGVWKLRHAFSWRRVLPFIAGGVAGVPAGTLLLAYSNPDHVKVGVGALVMAFSLYGLARPAVRIARAGGPADVGAGIANGMLAGLTGLIGIVITIWCQLRGWAKDEQRTVFQPVMLSTSVFTLASLAAAGAATAEALKLFLLGVPFVFAGTWLGLRAYGRVDDAGFRRIVLLALLASGASLMVR
jgi:uncharacterized membrane protein YfcA